MPISTTFKLPSSPSSLELPQESKSALFLCFISSNDPVSKQPWCPDVRNALPHVHAVFSGDGPEAALVEVGQRPEWRKPDNTFRVDWNVHNVPTLVRYQLVDGKVKETGRLVEDEILDKKKLHELAGKAT